jgi:hypothetical protein
MNYQFDGHKNKRNIKVLSNFNINNKVLLYVCVCVFVCSCPPVEGSCPLTRYQPQGKFTPPMPATSYPHQTPHQPLPEEMLADGYPLGNIDGIVTANFVGTIP